MLSKDFVRTLYCPKGQVKTKKKSHHFEIVSDFANFGPMKIEVQNENSSRGSPVKVPLRNPDLNRKECTERVKKHQERA